MTRTRFFLLVNLALVTLPFVGGSGVAQDVKWRHDYAAARKEATETGRPLLLDFGTEACFWCKKLDATTFRDPKVATLLNERFIPVKIDANKHPRLTQALNIESYPTLVLASAEGKVLGRHVGYAEVSQMMSLLNKAPVLSPVPARAVAPPSPVAKKPPAKADIDSLFPEIAAALKE